MRLLPAACVLQGLLARVDPSLDPEEAAMPLTRLPGIGLPTPVPVPNLQRLYFKVSCIMHTATNGRLHMLWLACLYAAGCSANQTVAAALMPC